MTHTQKELFQRLWQAKQGNRLPHALLLVGVKGTHKATFANSFAHSLLCQQVALEGDACQTCHACRLIKNRVHPNMLWIEPEKQGGTIKVEQIREINDFVNHTSLQGEYRIVIIHPADEMNVNAANALLKTLEEPSTGSLLILISDQQGHLPATVLSRCQRVVFPNPSHEEVLTWLKNQPNRSNLFQALVMLIEGKGNPIQLAEELHANDPIQLLDFLLSWITDLLRLQLNSDSTQLVNKDFSDQLMDLKQKTHLKKNVKLMDYLQSLRGQVCEGINFNKQLMLESIFVEWMECV